MNPVQWIGLRYPDSEVVGLVYRFARPPADVGALAIDVGCGPGRHARLLREVGYHAIGIDPDPGMVKQATANGVEAQLGRVESYVPPRPPELALCWGLTMLVPHGLARVAAWRPAVIIADWRTRANSCLGWPDNQPVDGERVRLRRPGHVLDGQEYFFAGESDVQVPGYERCHLQTLTKECEGERNEWYQAVFRRHGGTAG